MMVSIKWISRIMEKSRSMKIKSICFSTLWIICILLSITGCVYISNRAYYRYSNAPTVTALEREYKTWNTSLPSPTICSEEKIDRKKLNSFLQTVDENEREKVKEFLLQLAKITYFTLEDIKPIEVDIRPEDYMKILSEIRFDVKYQAQFNGKSVYRETITEMGICHAFNSEISQYNHPKFFFDNDSLSAPNGTIELVTGTPLNRDLMAIIMGINVGYEGYFTGPNDVADIASRSFKAGPNSYWSFEFGALSTVCTEDVRSLSVKQRKCRFSDESDLEISNKYSYTMCSMNCRWKLCQQLCGCAPHFYKQVGGVKTCDLDGLKCLKQYQELLVKLRDPATNTKVECNCLPTCEDMNYYVEKSQETYWFAGANLKFEIYSFPRIRIRRQIIFGFSDLMVSVGGAAGLLLGCSVLSFIEIIYFLSLRLFFYVRNK